MKDRIPNENLLKVQCELEKINANEELVVNEGLSLEDKCTDFQEL